LAYNFWAYPFRRIPGKFRPGIPPGESCMAEKQWMTYSQIAERLGVTPDAIRHRSRKEGWQRQEGNDGKIRVLIDPELLPESPARNSADSGPDSDRNSRHDSDHPDREVRRLEDHLQELRQRIDQQRTDHQAELARQRADHAAELERIRNELDQSRLDADRWREDAEHERQHSRALFEHSVDLADRLDRLHRERAADLARPWWRRLWGS
jgi:hypothetical protein